MSIRPKVINRHKARGLGLNTTRQYRRRHGAAGNLGEVNPLDAKNLGKGLFLGRSQLAEKGDHLHACDISVSLMFSQEEDSASLIQQITNRQENARMDAKSIRKKNLVSLIALYGSQNALAEAVDTAPAYISQILSDKSKASIGDALARKIEQKLGKPHGWMDFDHNAETPSSVNESQATYTALAPELQELLAAAKAAMNSGSITKDSILSMIELLRSLPRPSNDLKAETGEMKSTLAQLRKQQPPQ